MIERSFLRAKHWQLFSLLFGLPIVMQIYLMGFSFRQVFAEGQPQFESILPTIIVVFALVSISVFILFGWMWSIGVGLQTKIPEDVQMAVTRFKAFVSFPAIYILVLMGLTISMLTHLDAGVGETGMNPAYFFLIIPFHFFSMFCIFYSMYFVAKTIKTVELQKEAKFGDFVGEFFMMWFYPIGLWILQPKINQMSEEV